MIYCSTVGYLMGSASISVMSHISLCQKVQKRHSLRHVIYLQCVRKPSGKHFGFSWTGSQTRKSTERGFTPARQRTFAWTTWLRTSAVLRSIWTWWPEWVQHTQTNKLFFFLNNASYFQSPNKYVTALFSVSCFLFLESSWAGWKWRVSGILFFYICIKYKSLVQWIPLCISSFLFF